MLNNVDIKNLVGDKRAKELKTNFPKAVSYTEHFYNEDVFAYDFEANDTTLTKTSKSADGMHACHIRRHIFESEAEAKAFGREKIESAFAKQRREANSDNAGTFEPTWFDSEEDASAFFEEFLLTSTHIKQLAELERWAKNKGMGENDRCAITVPFNKVTGHGMAGGTRYTDLFECHAIRFVAEYTVYAANGAFAFYDAYPCYTMEDRMVIDRAKAEWRREKAARKNANSARAK